ncbi:CLUMA_CG009012, isoform A [Clunio marinus]|uniref:CLUMA_CG009012, isoform A n=1 Tax=Clunio marinus TaxID=568069 RepID=A0A1J1I5T7_9DIPT|nr:CLUMA_CG009012, isoform A [Clunio marinus]
MWIFTFLSFCFFFSCGLGTQFPEIIEMEAVSTSVHTFPKDFSFGASTAAYQIEGGWNEDGKGPSIWDTLTHTHPEIIADHSTADIGADSYHLYKKDVEALKKVGFQHYRFSISWSRIFPYGTKINAKAFDYYNKLIDELILNQIEPVVTLHHYDLPQWVQDEGGFLNPNVIEYFKLYADTIFREFGSRVKMWITFNEPFDACTEGYGRGVSAPLIKLSGVGEYICGHYLLLAHASAYHLYKSRYAKDQRGMIGITLDGRFYYPKDATVTNDIVERAIQFDIGWFANPIFSKDGGYPKVMIDEINERSKKEGQAWSRLPKMSKTTMKYVKGTADFLGYNYYSSRLVRLNTSDFDPNAVPSWLSDTRLIYETEPSWKQAKSSWLYSVPQGLHDVLVWFKNQYNNPLVLITENGWSDDGRLDDNDRIEYLKSHLISVSKAINEDKCNVIGYTTWSIIDNFEWTRGFTEHFGLFTVNLTSPEKERTAKKSAGYFHDVIKNRSV